MNIQIAELSFPFQAKVFEKELMDNGRAYREADRTYAEAGISSKIYYVCSADVENATILQQKMDKENAESEEKHIHPIRKVLAYLGLIPIAIYSIYQFAITLK